MQDDSTRLPRSPRRQEVLRVLKAAPGELTIAAVADELGVHPNTVRFHLDTLVADGQVEQVRTGRRQPGRPPLAFRAIRRMDLGGLRHYRLLAEILLRNLAEQHAPRAAALAAGRAWGRELESQVAHGEQLEEGQSTEKLVEVLEALGFEPEAGESNGRRRVGLRHCPFLELAEPRADIVCSVHLGIMQGALEHWRAPITVDELEPFVEPDLCLAHIAPRSALEGPTE